MTKCCQNLIVEVMRMLQERYEAYHDQPKKADSIFHFMKDISDKYGRHSKQEASDAKDN